MVGSLYARCRAQSCDPVSGPRFRSACADICKLLKLAQLSGFVASRLVPVALVVAALTGLTACNQGPAPLILEGPTMGTRYLVAVHDPVLSRSEATALVTAALDEVTRMLSTWGGLRTFAPDGLPVIKRDPLIPNFIWSAGQGGYGIQTAPAWAQAVVSLL